MPANWGVDQEKALLVALLDDKVDIPRARFADAATKLGEEYTLDSVRQKYYKLKREADAILSGSATAGNAAPSTPGKPKATAKSASSTKKRTKKQQMDEGRDEDDPIAATDETPTKAKRARKTPKKEAKGEVKKEEAAVRDEKTNGAGTGELPADADGADEDDDDGAQI